MAAGRWEICLRVLKNISRVSAANAWNICQHLKTNFAFPCGYAMSSIYSGLLVLNWCKAFSTGEIDRGAKCSYSNTALRKFLVIGQNARDQISSKRRSKRARSDCTLCSPFIRSGSPNECWLPTCRACIIATWRLALRPPLVVRI